MSGVNSLKNICTEKKNIQLCFRNWTMTLRKVLRTALNHWGTVGTTSLGFIIIDVSILACSKCRRSINTQPCGASEGASGNIATQIDGKYVFLCTEPTDAAAYIVEPIRCFRFMPMENIHSVTQARAQAWYDLKQV